MAKCGCVVGGRKKEQREYIRLDNTPDEKELELQSKILIENFVLFPGTTMRIELIGSRTFRSCDGPAAECSLVTKADQSCCSINWSLMRNNVLKSF